MVEETTMTTREETDREKRKRHEKGPDFSCSHFSFRVFRVFRGSSIPLLALLLQASVIQAAPPGQKLATELAGEGQYRAAAIEYRRLALATKEPDDRAAFYWGAAYAYRKSCDHELALKMLDHAEDASANYGHEATLLRLDTALSSKDMKSANFHAQSLEQSASAPLQHIARSRQAHIALRGGDPKLAATLMPTNALPEVTHAIHRYAAGHDKSPRLGGFLGLIPGLGYLYAGEPANALRSLLLNGLFIYGMVQTGEDEEWGAFSVITFFEITWYTGSIYGGIDASHRYNQRRLQTCLQVIDDQARFTPDLRKLPVIALKYQF
jgi:tetratricopeptide (TPR) repeat protein